MYLPKRWTSALSALITFAGGAHLAGPANATMNAPEADTSWFACSAEQRDRIKKWIKAECDFGGTATVSCNSDGSITVYDITCY